MIPEGPSAAEVGCRLCGRRKEWWQVFCGASCSVRWECGERPTLEPYTRDTVKMSRADIVAALEEDALIEMQEEKR